MRGRDLKLLVFAVLGLFLGAAPVHATTIPMTQGMRMGWPAETPIVCTVLFDSSGKQGTFLPGSFTSTTLCSWGRTICRCTR